ncbi:putative dienelactone hydrolase family protein [Phaeomoniella chlamydospora]|uniref:Putative dienelactone hydrolase family protein n=1 Tax=Phaeomoniella chlamydospora TaxID=158046 RepID=A0A0G2EJP4_PHACM|nr:putative dienelactone hydrolase family protein [Phaeomoniella chlamydospora]
MQARIPPVSVDYKEKGTYGTLDGLKTYITGSTSADTGILVIYDIFGYFPQTLQGADIIASADKEHPYQVFIPDFFEGEPADITWYPPKDDDTKAKLGNFFNTKAAPPPKIERIPKLLKDAQSQNPNIKTWGVLGYCWGGKVATLASGTLDVFKAGAEVHPAMVDPSDAEKIKIPFLCLASGDEPADDVKAFGEKLTGPKHIETFPEQIHGWMAARGDLKDPKVKDAYEKGYKKVITFFHEHL